jgi:hypothetical protein
MAEPIKFPKDADSRNTRIIVSDPSGLMQRCYCFICGKPAGWISKDSSSLVAPEHVLATCSDCDAKYGMMPLEQIPANLLEAFGIVPENRGPNVLV